MPAAWLSTVFCLAALWPLAGCGKLREISACRAISGEVNPTLDQIQTLSKRSGAEAELAMAKQYSDLAKRLKPHANGTGSLTVSVRDYATILESTSTALRNHAEAARTGSTGRVNEPRRELERLVKRERAAITRIEVECHN